MKIEVLIGPQVQAFVRSLAPEPRQALTRGIKALAKDQGDIKALEGKLASWSRLRVAGNRVLFKETASGGIRLINCAFAQKRSVVYDMFAQLLADELAG